MFVVLLDIILFRVASADYCKYHQDHIEWQWSYGGFTLAAKRNIFPLSKIAMCVDEINL